MHTLTIGPDELLTQGQAQDLTGIGYRALVEAGRRTGFVEGVQGISWVKHGRELLTTRREVDKFLRRREQLNAWYLDVERLKKRIGLPKHMRTASDVSNRITIGGHGVSVFGSVALPPAFKFQQLRGHRFYEPHVNRYLQVRHLVIESPREVADILREGVYWPEYDVPMYCEMRVGWSDETRIRMLEAQQSYCRRMVAH